MQLSEVMMINKNIQISADLSLCMVKLLKNVKKIKKTAACTY